MAKRERVLVLDGGRVSVGAALASALASVKGQSWYCVPCAVEVYDRRCPHCGKLERDKT